jgi:hypothetical protein
MWFADPKWKSFYQFSLRTNAYKLLQSSNGVVTDDLPSKNKNNASLSSSHSVWSNRIRLKHVQLKHRRRNDVVITSTCVCSTKEMARSLTDEKQRSPWRVSLAILRSETGKANSCASVSKKICEVTCTSSYTSFDSQTKPMLSHTKSAVDLKRAEFVCACWIRHNLIACRQHPPLHCKHRSREQRHRMQGWGRKRPRQNQHKLKFHFVFP